MPRYTNQVEHVTSHTACAANGSAPAHSPPRSTGGARPSCPAPRRRWPRRRRRRCRHSPAHWPRRQPPAPGPPAAAAWAACDSSTAPVRGSKHCSALVFVHTNYRMKRNLLRRNNSKHHGTFLVCAEAARLQTSACVPSRASLYRLSQSATRHVIRGLPSPHRIVEGPHIHLEHALDVCAEHAPEDARRVCARVLPLPRQELAQVLRWRRAPPRGPRRAVRLPAAAAQRIIALRSARCAICRLVQVGCALRPACKYRALAVPRSLLQVCLWVALPCRSRSGIYLLLLVLGAA